MDKFNQIEKLIGNTPLIKIKYKFNNKIKYIYAKLEWYNLSGSIKDRPAFEILKSAYKNKQLYSNQIICETTSGNMGISICAIAKMLGNEVVICMPKFMSEERKQLLKLYGAKLELVDNFNQAFKRAKEYKINGAYLTYQFENPQNIYSHYKKTAIEICNKLNNIPCFISGVGTGGTLMGIGKYLKEKYNTKIVALDPYESRLLSTKHNQGHHKIQGLSDEIIPKLYNEKLVDKIITIKSDDAICMSKKLCSCLGLGVGISSGANFLACCLNGINNSVTIFADDNKKYLSTDLSKNIDSDLVNQIELIDYKVI